MKAGVLQRLLEASRHGRTPVLVTGLRSGDQRVLFPLEEAPAAPEDSAPSAAGGASGAVPSDLAVDPVELLEAARRAIAEDRPVRLEGPAGDTFLRPFNPPVRLIVVGAVHVAQPLATMASTAGFAVTVVDPRVSWADPSRFPGIEVMRAWPDAALASLSLDHRTAVAALTHDPKLDDPALTIALDSPAFYVGALGSRRTHQKRRARLLARGVSETDLDRIHAPIGLDLGARSPAEIAVSVLAQMVQHLRLGARSSPT